MGRNVAIGIQNFNEIIEKNCFYVDKTHFIKEWWDSNDSVTLITRPRRFGKTLTMSMVEQFFSVEYAGRRDLFEGLKIWGEDKYRELQGTYPVISLSFANVKEKTYEGTKRRICQLITELYNKNLCNHLLQRLFISISTNRSSKLPLSQKPNACPCNKYNAYSQYRHSPIGAYLVCFDIFLEYI